MDKKTIGIISVISTSLLCGIPGLAGLCFGSMAILGSLLPDNGIDPADTTLLTVTVIGILCLSLVFIAIPIVVGFLSLGKSRIKPIASDVAIPEEDF
jgi:hypothetical protein